MKKIISKIITLALSAVLCSPAIFADAKTQKQSLHKVIEKNMHFTRDLRGIAGNAVVYVSFTVNEQSEIIVQDSNGTDKAFTDYVVKKLSGLNMSNTETENGRIYSIKISFHTQS